MAEKKATKKTTGKKASPKGSIRKVVKAKTAQPGGETDIIRKVTQALIKKNNQIADFSSGDTVGVYVKVREGDKERVQLYKGVVIKVQGKGTARSFTVRKISSGVGVERTFPISSPSLDRVEIISHGKVRRKRLYYLRDLKGKAARLQFELAAGLADQNPEGAAPEDQHHVTTPETATEKSEKPQENKQ